MTVQECFLLFLKKNSCSRYPEWAESLTEMGKGKHFIGDFLPPEELEKFMETFKALKVSVLLPAYVRNFAMATFGCCFFLQNC